MDSSGGKNELFKKNQSVRVNAAISFTIEFGSGRGL